MSVGQIADDLGRSTKTIRKWFARFDGEGEDGMKQRPKSGRPRTTSAEQDQAMVEVNATFSWFCFPFRQWLNCNGPDNINCT